jgi:Protein of unknown function (DUF3592)
MGTGNLFIYLILLAVTVGIGAFMIWFGRMFMRVSAAAKQVNADLDARGVNAQAQIVNHRDVIGKTSSYYITYQYAATAADGTAQTLTNEEAIKSDDYRALNLGDQVTVRYLPDQPKTVRIESGAQETYTPTTWLVSAWVLIVLGALLAVFGAVLVFGAINSDNQKAAQATATAVARASTPNAVQKTATVQVAEATRQADVAMSAKLRLALAARIADWKSVGDRDIHRVLPPETDLGLDEIEIDYGYCDSGHFYTYVWFHFDRTNLVNEIFTSFDGYGYVEDDALPAKCYPKEYSSVWSRNSGSLGKSWYAVSGATNVKVQK